MGFYCYNCGKSVNRNSKSCPSCGVRFKAVRCPSCGYTDEADFFKGGCPRCGYMGSHETNESPKQELKNSLFGFIPPRLFWTMSGLLILILFLLVYFLLKP